MKITSTDFSSLSAQEMALTGSDSQLRRIYETMLTNIPDFVYVFSLDHRVLYANDALIKMWGRGVEGAIGKTFLEIGYEPWHAEMHDREIDQVRATRQPIRGEVPFNGTSGRRDYEYIFVPVFGSDGEVEAVAGTTRDVTERKQTENQLRRNQDTFYALIQNNPFGMYAVDADFRLQHVSLGAQKVFETVRPLIGRDFAEVLRNLWPESFANEVISRFRHTLDTGEPYSAPSTVAKRVDIGVVESYDWRIERIHLPDGRYGVVCYFYDLSERQRWELTLLESEERSSFVRRSSGVGFWYCDLPFNLLEWDDLVKAHFHLPPDAIVTIETFYERIHPDDREPTRQAIEQSISGRLPYDVDYRTVDPETGAIKWIRAIGRTVHAPDGSPTRFDGVTLDMTERKRVEDALRKSEIRQAFAITLADALRPLSDPISVKVEASQVLGQRIEASRVVYFEVHGDEFVVQHDYTNGVPSIRGHYLLNSFGSEMLSKYQSGLTATESDVESLPSLSPEQRAALAAVQIRSYVGVPLVKEGLLVAGMAVHSATPRVWTANEIEMIEDTAEQTWAAVERVQAEQQLRVSEEQRKLALDSAGLGIWHIDPITNSLTNDERFRILFTGTTESVSYEQAVAALHPDDRQRVQDAIAASTRTDDPAPYSEDYRVVHPDGSIHWVSAKGRVNYGGKGPVLQCMSFDGTVADITDRKQAEDELRRLATELAEADRRKDEFLATLAHELRNPLAPIRNGLEVMRLAGTGGRIEQARSMMERQMTQLVRLVDDLLDVSRVTSGKLELRKERLELRAVIDAAIETSLPVIDEAGHKLSVDLPNHSIVLDGDQIRLAQVISNLLNNSAKYTPKGGKIRLTVRCGDGMAVVSVADDGIGIPPNMLNKVFQMFSQVDRDLEKTTGGLGLGLALVKGLVEMHGGTIHAHSEGEGHGSEFILKLPAVLSLDKKEEHIKADELFNSLPSRRILLADDNRDSTEWLGQLLEMTGNEVRTAHDGLQALAEAEAFRPDVILLDIGMPGLNGHETCRRIREQPWGKDVALIAMTGWGQEEDRRQSREAGFDHHLVKPVELTVLEKLLSELQPNRRQKST